ncbi:hypothetical protein KA001_01500 [Patescibacteria group bacterium]|nr:hypothetical protein [Patescibacteria group bacterium]
MFWLNYEASEIKEHPEFITRGNEPEDLVFVETDTGMMLIFESASDNIGYSFPGWVNRDDYPSTSTYIGDTQYSYFLIL